ncbi:hypothetical protein [Methanosarcina sp.]|uniref:hypothetical protein n=1 Tax=Methanosarcina sp. TaxID=2213 RepID=UPI0029880F7A|nr:hypothetical protein [Methanosarcina sp.]MDW5552296.1 hypothetical protein [Methanosarcina sp.]
MVEKKEEGGDKQSKEYRKSLGQNDPVRSSAKIAELLSVGEKTVRRAAEYTQAVDTIVANTGIKASDILSGRMTGFQDDIKALSELDADSQKRIAHFILEEGEADLESATNRLKREKQDKLLKEAEEKEKLVRGFRLNFKLKDYINIYNQLLGLLYHYLGQCIQFYRRKLQGHLYSL